MLDFKENNCLLHSFDLLFCINDVLFFAVANVDGDRQCGH